MVLWKFAWRHILGRRGRTVLTLLSVVIAIAAVTSVNIATSTTRLAYREMFVSVSGRAALEISADGGSRFDPQVLAQVREIPGVRAASPLVQRPTIMYAGGRRVKLLALGVAPEQGREVRDYSLAEGRLLADGDRGVLLEKAFAETIGVRTGDEVKLLTPRGMQRVTVVGLISAGGVSALRLGGLVFMPLEQSQRFFATGGQIDSIQLVLDAGADVEAVERAVARRLPPGISVRPPATRTPLVEETLSASEQGLRLASAFSLVLAVFIILNTAMMNVSERRRQLAIMRAVGATRRQITRLLVGESLALGVVGTLLGSLAGWGCAYVLTTSMERILMASLPPLQVTAWPFALAALCGLGVSLAGVTLPARRAGQLSPLEGMSHVTREDVEGSRRKPLVAGALVTLVSGSVLAGCILGRLSIDYAIPNSVFLLVGVGFLAPAVLPSISRAVVALLSPLLRVEAALAHREILRHRGRSALTANILFLASATGVGMAGAVLDNVEDVRDWYRKTMVGDYFIRAMMPDMATGRAADIPEELGSELRTIPGITSIDATRFVQGRAEGRTVVFIIRQFNSAEADYFDLEDSDPEAVRQKLLQGEVVIGTVLAERAGLKAGATLTVETLQGPKELPIAALANEYMVGGLAVFMERSVAQRLLGVEGVDAYLLQVAPDARLAVRDRLQTLCEKHGVLLHSFAGVRRMIDRMIAGIQGCLWGILFLGLLVGASGVVNTLTMNVLEQTRELGLLRVVAMTRWQVRRMIFAEAAILGTIGVGPGVAAGVAVGYLINLATMSAIGHPIPFGFHPALLAGCFFGALALVLFAAMIPAERAARLSLSRALQYE